MLLKTIVQLFLIPLISATNVTEGVTETDTETDEESLKVEPRIYGGQATTQQEMGRFPVQLHGGGSFICTGSMISSYDVLTAAHCLERVHFRNMYVISDETYRVSDNGDRNFVVNAKVHPSYNKLVGDIAVLNVGRPMKGKPIPLCSRPLGGGYMVTVAGWGRADYEAPGHPLRKMVIPVLTHVQCQARTGYKPNNVICASGFNGKTVCYGDSGGPLVYNGEVCGVTSATGGCGNYQYPDFYMSVWYYRDFIRGAMSSKGGGGGGSSTAKPGGGSMWGSTTKTPERKKCRWACVACNVHWFLCKLLQGL